MKEQLKELILRTPTGDTIYPKDIVDKFHISMKSAYIMLEELVDDGLLTSVLETWCPNCRKFTGLQYDAFWDVPKEVLCPHCGKAIEEAATDNSLVVYKRI